MRGCFLILPVFVFMVSWGREDTTVYFVEKIHGRVEINRSGQVDWGLLKKGQECRHNDKLHVHSGGGLELYLPDGTQVFIAENSKMLIAISERDRKPGTKGLSLYFGSLYFRTPTTQDLSRHAFNRIYTPSAALQTRNAGFYVSVSENETEVFIFRGVVHMRHLKFAQELFANEGTRVRIGERLSEPGSFREDKIRADLGWVDSSLLIKDLTQGKLEQKRRADIISGNPHGRVIVMDFEVGRKNVHWDLARVLPDFIAGGLTETTYREIIRGGGLGTNVTQHGGTNGNDKVIKGEVASFFFGNKAILPEGKRKYQLNRVVEMKMNFTILQPETGKILKSFSLTVRESENLDASHVPTKTILARQLNINDKIIRECVLSKGLQSLKRQFTREVRKVL